METDLLRTFVEVCRHGSISGAAAALSYTQSGVSRQVAGLEAELGHRLLERRPRGVEPTPEGEALLVHAHAVLRELDRLTDAVAAPGLGPKRLVVGAFPSAVQTVVPHLVRELAHAHPETKLIVHEALSADLMARVAVGELDAAVVTDCPPGLAGSDELVIHPIRDDEMVVVLPDGHRHAKGRTRLPLGRLADDVWVEDNRGSEQLLRQAALRAGFVPHIEHGCGSLAGKVALVGAGLGVAIVPGMLLPALGAGVVARPLVDPPVRSVYVAVHRSVGGSPQVVTLVDTVRALRTDR